MERHFDFVVVGSGFGGSVSALRLAEKGYRVLVLEKGRRWTAEDFPLNNWDLRKWMWLPDAGLQGFFKMTFFKHLTVLSGVGVGGGSLVYANTLPVPKEEFFTSGSWAGLRDWKKELVPHYATAKRMLGAARNPRLSVGDEVLRELAAESGRPEHFEPTEVGVYFGQPEVTVKDPFFGGEGPDRTGCHFCGACMTGCRHGAKNTLDRNYLYLAEKKGVTVVPETQVVAVRPRAGGFLVQAEQGLSDPKLPVEYTADRVVLAGGVMGTTELLLRMRAEADGLPDLSPRVGDMVRTNSESLLGVVTTRDDVDLTKGIAIGSIFHTDAHSHLEPVRFGDGSGFFRSLMAPYVPGASFAQRLLGSLKEFARQPKKFLGVGFVRDFARHCQVLLYMRSQDEELRLRLGRSLRTGFRKGLVTELGDGPPPQAFMPEATEFARRFAEKLDGVVVTLFTEMALGVPQTAHILGGACIGKDAQAGVVDERHQVFNYPGLYVVDGAAVSANPGVNPSLTITAMAERALSHLEPKARA